MNINKYFDELIENLENINEELITAKNKLDSTANYLNRAYAKRIIDWSLDKYEPLTDEGILNTISKVERVLGKNIIITTKIQINLPNKQEELKLILQEDVSIISNTMSG